VYIIINAASNVQRMVITEDVILNDTVQENCNEEKTKTFDNIKTMNKINCQEEL
jgi:hypothetical protein